VNYPPHPPGKVEKPVLTRSAAEYARRAAELRVENVVHCGSLRLTLRNFAVNGFDFNMQTL